jgi:SEC-C motif-containing protein
MHLGDPASTPEALMRSRFAAFVQKRPEYLRATWHPDTRPVTLDLDDSPDWTSLQVISSEEHERRGQVHFRAIYRVSGEWGYLEEVSDFVKEGGHWYYLSGETGEGVLKPGRNERCPCGSGKKYKACCL